ncbi:hypothetical protein [Arthrobacter sp. 3Tela_A]|uniref:hypothetical protein n=1 Tax=Arthrobacter sp. 3Tela_A TaxID=3093743 RepID=UPI003BB68A6A
MEIGSKAKKIIVWSASGLAAAGLLTGTFFTGMAVADNSQPASVTSELDGERPDHGDHGNLPQDSERQDKDAQDKDSQEKDAQEKDSQNNDGGEGTDEVRPDRPDHDGGPDREGKPGKGESGKGESGKGESYKDRRGERGDDGHRHGHPDSEADAPAENALAEDEPAEDAPA